MGWNMDREYARLDESVEAPPPGASAEAQRRWGSAGRQVTASLGAVDAMLGGQSFEDFAAQAAARRGMAQQETSTARTSVSTEGALAFGALFVPAASSGHWEPEPSSSSSSTSDFGAGTLLLPMGANNERLVLVDLSGQSPERVAIEDDRTRSIRVH